MPATPVAASVRAHLRFPAVPPSPSLPPAAAPTPPGSSTPVRGGICSACPSGLRLAFGSLPASPRPAQRPAAGAHTHRGCASDCWRSWPALADFTSASIGKGVMADVAVQGTRITWDKVQGGPGELNWLFSPPAKGLAEGPGRRACLQGAQACPASRNASCTPSTPALAHQPPSLPPALPLPRQTWNEHCYGEGMTPERILRGELEPPPELTVRRGAGGLAAGSQSQPACVPACRASQAVAAHPERRLPPTCPSLPPWSYPAAGNDRQAARLLLPPAGRHP